MCKGLQQENKSGYCLSNTDRVPRSMNCELCNSRAVLYCEADDAYLCRKCDQWVHEANFLALRHVRCFLCGTCQNVTQRYLIGASREAVLPTGRRHCDSDMETKHSTKTHFLFL
ncbi:microProtein 1a, B-box domain protein 31 [Hibiscus trionum]|uniref:MicroProtein 1a, B-box domain protein 31 n=1 Tax=Hibiscus trionum TaxID=183268 RepID=A0A9W7J5F1_HIBTR|nr:microProtein 1a, B-box domain protein 31 [Hibiscus trionum]